MPVLTGGATVLKRAERFFVIATLFTMGANAGAAAVLPRDGDYLSTAYLAALEKTRSHLKAWDTGAPQAITVSRDKRGLVLSLTINWHEGNSTVFDLNNPAVVIQQDDGGHQALIPIDANHFRFRDDEGTKAYQYIGNEQRYLIGKLLAGTYRDAHGKTYMFGTDGKAQFPDRTFRYEVYTDMVFERIDQFVDRDASKPNAWKTYGFEWKGQTLYLYNLDCPDTSPSCTPEKAKPLAVLHSVLSAGR